MSVEKEETSGRTAEQGSLRTERHAIDFTCTEKADRVTEHTHYNDKISDTRRLLKYI